MNPRRRQRTTSLQKAKNALFTKAERFLSLHGRRNTDRDTGNWSTRENKRIQNSVNCQSLTGNGPGRHFRRNASITSLSNIPAELDSTILRYELCDNPLDLKIPELDTPSPLASYLPMYTSTSSLSSKPVAELMSNHDDPLILFPDRLVWTPQQDLIPIQEYPDFESEGNSRYLDRYELHLNADALFNPLTGVVPKPSIRTKNPGNKSLGVQYVAYHPDMSTEKDLTGLDEDISPIPYLELSSMARSSSPDNFWQQMIEDVSTFADDHDEHLVTFSPPQHHCTATLGESKQSYQPGPNSDNFKSSHSRDSLSNKIQFQSSRNQLNSEVPAQSVPYVQNREVQIRSLARPLALGQTSSQWPAKFETTSSTRHQPTEETTLQPQYKDFTWPRWSDTNYEDPSVLWCREWRARERDRKKTMD